MALLKDIMHPTLTRIKQRAAELPQENYLFSLYNYAKRTTEGTICTAEPLLAAQCEVEGTHRLCTPEEIEKYKADEEIQRQRYTKAEYDRRNEFNINVTVPAQPAMTPDMSEMFRQFLIANGLMTSEQDSQATKTTKKSK